MGRRLRASGSVCAGVRPLHRPRELQNFRWISIAAVGQQPAQQKRLHFCTTKSAPRYAWLCLGSVRRSMGGRLRRLEAFARQHGHCRVPHKHKTADGYRLGIWVAAERKNPDNMPIEQKARLATLGFIWDPYAANWKEGFQHLQSFVREHGHCRVPQGYATADGYRLGVWVHNKRQHKDKVSEERKARLDEVGYRLDCAS